MPEEDDTHRSYKKQNRTINELISDNSSIHNVYTLNEQEKTQDLIKSGFYENNNGFNDPIKYDSK